MQNMPGAGSLVALNYVNNAAPHDGTVIGMVNPVTTVQHMLQPEVANFDPLKLNWIGSMTTDYYNCGFWTDKPMTLADLQSKHFIVGSTATTGGTYAGDRVFEAVLHLDFKIVPGYTNLGELRQASERGEVQGFCGVMAMTLKSTFWPTYQAKQLQIPVRANLTPDPDMPDVPNAFDLVKSEEDRQLLMLLAGPWYFGRPFMAPPDVPAPRLEALRAAFACDARRSGAARRGEERKSRNPSARRRSRSSTRSSRSMTSRRRSSSAPSRCSASAPVTVRRARLLRSSLRAKRSNPGQCVNPLDCFVASLLAMTPMGRTAYSAAALATFSGVVRGRSLICG